jgi:hypothetical protein
MLYSYRQVIQAKTCPALRVLGQGAAFSFLILVAEVLVLALAR